jgi:hypothetical protein
MNYLHYLHIFYTVILSLTALNNASISLPAVVSHSKILDGQA